MRLLCTGDIHLGRNPTRIPIERVPDQTPYSTRAIWERIVDLAIEERVDALLISGDLVDRDNRFFEALGPVETGIEKLAHVGIPVVAVAGNHDFDVLPRLADRHGDTFRLLGRNQQWERHTILDSDGHARLHIHGWSFGTQHTSVEPLATWAFDTPDDVPVIGLLHCDLDQSNSKYAPARLGELRATPVQAWLIGHVHTPAHHNLPGGPPVLYPGSPVPLDPGESGEHGVWMLDIEPGQAPRYTSWPIAPLWYHQIPVDLSGAADVHEAGNRIFDALKLHADASTASYLLYRVKLTGRTHLGPERHAKFEEIRTQQHTAQWSIETMIDETRPAIDLNLLATEASPPGVVARMLLSLDSPHESASLLAQARAAIDAQHISGASIRIRDVEPPGERELLEHAAWELLETLIAQREVAS